MYIYNTTFHIDKAVEPDFMDWLCSYRDSAMATGAFAAARLLTVRSEHMEDGTAAFALHLEAADLSAVRQWAENGEADSLAEIFRRWPQRAVAFSTLLEELC